MSRETVYLWKLSVVAGVACGIFGAIVQIFPAPMNNYLPFALLGLAITFGCGPDPKLTGSYMLSLWCGVVWGIIVMLIMIGPNFTGGVQGLGAPGAFFVDVTIVTFLACVVHLIIPGIKKITNLAVVFVGICCFLATNGDFESPYAIEHILMIGIAMCLGSLLAISLNPITGLFHKK